jgi:predicted aconitase with swiveling domain
VIDCNTFNKIKVIKGEYMAAIILKGHKISKGKAQGEALVSQSPISFTGGVDPETGLVVEKGHELEGKSVAGKVLVFPTGKGSTAGSYQLYELAYNKKAPRAMINLRADSIAAIGAILSGIPMVDRLDKNPLEIIKTNDLVEVDADQGIVKIGDRF